MIIKCALVATRDAFTINSLLVRARPIEQTGTGSIRSRVHYCLKPEHLERASTVPLVDRDIPRRCVQMQLSCER